MTHEDKLIAGDRVIMGIAAEVAELVAKKQRDYGSNNILEFAETGVLIRANDKLARLKNLHIKGVQPQNESIDDGWLDLAGYSFIALALRRGQFYDQIQPPQSEWDKVKRS